MPFARERGSRGKKTNHAKPQIPQATHFLKEELMEMRNSTAVAAATLSLAVCVSITSQPAPAATISWGSPRKAAGAADLVPTTSLSAVINSLLVGGSTGGGSTGGGQPVDAVDVVTGGSAWMGDSFMATHSTSGGRYPLSRPRDPAAAAGLLAGFASGDPGLLDPQGCWQGMASPVHMTLHGSDLMPLYDYSVKGLSLDPRSGYEWREVSVGVDASRSLASSPTQRSSGPGR